jgi:hypothetical protein
MRAREWFEEWLLDEKKPKQQKPQKSHSAIWMAYNDEPNMNPDPITGKDIPRLAGMSILFKLVIAALIGAVLLIVANSNG